eukprot:TRINITY_DN15189_c0_g1_i2.p4 TRINITY_DN15189_c0_g1~~TRINITY_DN15189_c0_g1_i2.p4  ORF type:complete len:102 (+),score=20.10 TRINITY_DN15189_c0_g1_i2:39-344(+)
MIRRPPRSTQGVSSAASDVYKRQAVTNISIRAAIDTATLAEFVIFSSPNQAPISLPVVKIKHNEDTEISAKFTDKHVSYSLLWTPQERKAIPVIILSLIHI